ncbi:SKN1/KRE6 family protein [Pleurotus pulmonarius]
MDSPASSDHPPLKSELVLPGFKEVFTPSRRHSWASCQTDSPYTAGAGSIGASSKLNSLLLSEQYSLSPDPREWGFDLSPHLEEPDDALHNPDAQMDRPEDRFKDPCSRGVLNLGCLALLGLFFVALFIGYPVGAYVAQQRPKFYGYNIGGINSTGQVPSMGNFGLIDQDTPKDALQHTSWRNPGDEWTLVFSDEFNTQGRSFYPGDDPYWEAVDLHYWATNNLEWYDPEAVSTQDGSLVIKFSQLLNHDLNYQGGLISTWNKFCFTGGLIETSVSLPGVNNVMGLWPAVWTMGNLGRAGYGATLDGLWPYTYDACDVGTMPNQTLNGLPQAALINGDHGHNDILSFLPGQRLSRCTCEGESHPGPKHEDGTYVGRSAPEIDVFEAQMSGTPLSGEVSQSAQWAPFNAGYVWNNDTTTNMIIRDSSITRQNSFIGSITQQATSVITKTNPDCYELEQGCFSIYAFEYKPGFDDAYILWVSDNKESWTLNVQGLGPDPAVEISARPVPQEPMYILINLGMSKNFGEVDVAHLTFPVHMHVDYIRVYQPKDAINIGCSPRDFPTEAYINRYLEAYTNPNLTTWTGDYQQPWPKNSFAGQC